MARYRPLILSALLASAACNAAFELVPTIGPDSDGDGIDDYHDNCPLAANAEQANRDGDALGDVCDPCDGSQSGSDDDHDGIDDACDPCPAGANTDEDGDTFLDGCDACPGTYDDQADDDGDGIGNVCDAEPGVANRRVLFDGFDEPRAGWRAWLATWEATGTGALIPSGSFGGATGAWNPAAAIEGNQWWVEVSIELRPDPAMGEYAGLFVLERTSGDSPTSCLIAWDVDGWRPASEYTHILTVGPSIRVRYHANAGADECRIDDTPAMLLYPSVTSRTYVPALASAGRYAFRWIDVVSR